MKVTIIIVTSKKKQCKCDDGLDHWDKFNVKKQHLSVLCSAKLCSNLATNGTHVQKEGNAALYIIPLCDKHNNMQGETFDIKDDTSFASANISETCGKKKSVDIEAFG